MAFLRESRPDHWGIKKAKQEKEKKKMAEREMKTCEQCGETKDAENYFDRAPRGFRKICVKCVSDNFTKMNYFKNCDLETWLKYSSAGERERIQKNLKKGLNVAKVKADVAAKEPVAKTEAEVDDTIESTDESKSIIIDEAGPIDEKTFDELNSHETPEGLNVTTKLKVTRSAENCKIELDFTGRQDLYDEICDIAKDQLRKPENQVLWWLINTDFNKLNAGLSTQ